MRHTGSALAAGSGVRKAIGLRDDAAMGSAQASLASVLCGAKRISGYPAAGLSCAGDDFPDGQDLTRAHPAL